MEQLSYLLGIVCRVILDVLFGALFLRAVLSIFLKKNNPVIGLLSYVTEPLLAFVRTVTSRLRCVSESPIDIPCCIACAIIAALSVLFGIWF